MPYYAPIGIWKKGGWDYDDLSSNTVLFIDCTEWSSGTTFTESSPSGHTVTLHDNSVQGSDADGPFWSFDGDDHLSVPTSQDWNITSPQTDWTIDFWMKHSEVAGEYEVFSWRDPSAMYDTPIVLYRAVDLSLYVYGSSTGTSWINWAPILTLGPVPVGWHHVAITRESGVFRIFLDGVCGAQNFALSNVVLRANTNPLRIAWAGSGGGYDGDLSMFRITKGEALWSGSASFTPPRRLS